MELKAEENVIEISPDTKFATELIAQLKHRIGGLSLEHWLHHDIWDRIGLLVTSPIVIHERTKPFRFAGGNDRALQYDGDIAELYVELCYLIEVHSVYIPSINHNTIDNLLYATYFSWGERSYVESGDGRMKYLDELIELYVRLRNKKVVIGNNTDFIFDEDTRKKKFEHLPVEIQEQLISTSDVKAEGRIVGGNGKLVYIPTDMKIAIVDRNGGDDIIVPESLSNVLYNTILKEIVTEHERHATAFYSKLSNEDFSSHELESRSTYRKSAKNVKLVSHLVSLMDGYLLNANPVGVVKKHRYVLIYDILKSLRYIDYNHANREDKYSYIRTVVRDNAPDKLAKRLGEKQLYR